MQTVGQIIRMRRESLGLTLAGVAQAVGATKSYLSMIENHRTAHPPSRRLLEALERALGIGDGELIRAADWQNTPDPVRQQLTQQAQAAQRGRELAAWLRKATEGEGQGAAILDQLFQSGELAQHVNKALGAAEEQTTHSSSPHQTMIANGHGIDGRVPVRYQVPLINHVAAGYPTDFTDLDYPARVADSYVTCPDLADPQAFAARVVGQSMMPQYREGDVVVFSPAADVINGCDCFVRLEPDHASTFKRIFFEGENQQRIRLQPLNKTFAAHTVQREQVTGMYRAVWHYQKLA